MACNANHKWNSWEKRGGKINLKRMGTESNCCGNEGTIKFDTIDGGFDHRHLRSICRISWDHLFSNPEVRCRLLVKCDKSIDELVNLYLLRCSGYVLLMAFHWIRQCAMMSDVRVGRNEARTSQSKTWHQSMRTLTIKLTRINRCRLPGWCPHDYRCQWLETVGDVTQNHSQWCRYIHSQASKSTIIFFNFTNLL